MSILDINTSDIADEHWKVLRKYTAHFGDGTNFGLRVSAALGHDVTEEEINLTLQFTDALQKLWQEEKYRTNPTYQVRAQVNEEQLLSLFPGGTAVFHDWIPNGYHSDWYYMRWLKVMTRVGEITVGWRKRVIHIDWSKSRCPLPAVHLELGEKLMSASHDADWMHAWSVEDARVIVHALLNWEQIAERRAAAEEVR